ncbi:MAG: hypothetical protein V4598_10100 [Bdellovibrionota bacterium]
MKYLFITLSYLITLTASAATQTLTTKYGRIFVPDIKGWELGKNMFGMPFLYFSPQENGQRSNISFTNTGVDGELDLPSLGKNPELYHKMKKEWAETIDAKVLGFSPFRTWKNDQGHTVNEIGVEYTAHGKDYVEKSYYIDCRGRLLYSKSLRLKVNDKHTSEFESLVKKMDCGV